MKWIFSLAISLFTMLILSELKKYVNFTISDFLIGWLSCMGYLHSIRYLKKKKDDTTI
jgi:hypothetical protein